MCEVQVRAFISRSCGGRKCCWGGELGFKGLAPFTSLSLLLPCITFAQMHEEFIRSFLG